MKLHTTIGHLINNTWFLKKVLLYHCSLNVTIIVKMNINILSESTRVIISTSLGITKCWEKKQIKIINEIVR